MIDDRACRSLLKLTATLVKQRNAFSSTLVTRSHGSRSRGPIWKIPTITWREGLEFLAFFNLEKAIRISVKLKFKKRQCHDVSEIVIATRRQISM